MKMKKLEAKQQSDPEPEQNEKSERAPDGCQRAVQVIDDKELSILDLEFIEIEKRVQERIFDKKIGEVSVEQDMAEVSRDMEKLLEDMRNGTLLSQSKYKK